MKWHQNKISETTERSDHTSHRDTRHRGAIQPLKPETLKRQNRNRKPETLLRYYTDIY